ncbi:MAG: saccharopine dehydrogenase NADP-binding domain-containing protein [Candidatus Bipolaricaulota bacterium]|nr:MAG: saccharopine dehydrogenase NADP-binding domain-containing protein [Candidatus Bipolaricaulota bacterium]
MTRVLVLGAGMMGTAVAYDLAGRPEIDEVRLADRDVARAEAGAERIRSKRVIPYQLDATAPRAVQEAMTDCVTAVSAAPYFLNAELARCAVASGTHFCDLGGNRAVVESEFALDAEARDARVTIVPDCGLAPGLTNILAAGAVAALDHVDELRLRVGGLPQTPHPPLDYQIVFSPHGLINEYAEPCLVLREGAPVEVPPLTEVEPIAFPPDYPALEAFHTSGGSSTLAQTLAGRVTALDYKTIRYPGHARIAKALLDLGFFDEAPHTLEEGEVVPRALTMSLLMEHLDFAEPDVVLVRVEARGSAGGRARVARYELVDRADPGTGLTAMMRCTGFPAAEVAYRLATGDIDTPGAQPQELVVPPDPCVKSLRARGLKIEHTVTDG